MRRVPGRLDWLSGGITTSASAARTAVVEMVGGRSQLASVTVALGMLAVLLFATEPLENLPTIALAAVVIAAVLRLIEVSSLRELWRTRRFDFVIAISTTVGAVAIGLLQGIAIGVGLSLCRRLPARGVDASVAPMVRQGVCRSALPAPPPDGTGTQKRFEMEETTSP
jgi:hypothetical protein